MRFTSRNKDFDYYIYGLDVEDYDADIIIEWGVDLEVRDYGIKSIIPTIYNVAIELTNNDTYEPIEIDFTYYKVSQELEIENGMLSINDIDIDINKKTILIY